LKDILGALLFSFFNALDLCISYFFYQTGLRSWQHGEEGANEQRGERRKKGPGSKSKISCTLEQLFTGSTRRMSIGRKTIDKNSMTTCRQCGGQGAIVRMMRMGPMVQQIQQTCDSCSGAGHSYKSVQKTEVLEVNLWSQFVHMLWFIIFCCIRREN